MKWLKLRGIARVLSLFYVIMDKEIYENEVKKFE